MFAVHCNIHTAEMADLLSVDAQMKEMCHTPRDVIQFSCGLVPGSSTDNQTHTQVSHTVGRYFTLNTYLPGHLKSLPPIAMTSCLTLCCLHVFIDVVVTELLTLYRYDLRLAESKEVP